MITLYIADIGLLFGSKCFFLGKYYYEALAALLIGSFEVFGKADEGFLYRVVGQQLAHFDGFFYLQQPDAALF